MNEIIIKICIYFGSSPGWTLPFFPVTESTGSRPPTTLNEMHSEWSNERMYVLEGCLALMPIVSCFQGSTLWPLRFQDFKSHVSPCSLGLSGCCRLECLAVRMRTDCSYLGCQLYIQTITARRLMTAPFLCRYYSLYPPFSHTQGPPKIIKNIVTNPIVGFASEIFCLPHINLMFFLKSLVWLFMNDAGEEECVCFGEGGY